jgi:hypothetical protein
LSTFKTYFFGGAYTNQPFKNLSRMINLKILFSSIFCLLVFHFTFAHPGMGLVIDSKGNIFYTDLKHIWKQTPDGKKSIAVKNVHSHELYMDKNDNLFGEHYWYASTTDKWFHYEWLLKSSGELTNVTDTIEPSKQPHAFSFVRDTNGNMYWYEKSINSDTVNFIKKDILGQQKIIGSGTFKDIRWLFSKPNGEIYFLDLDDLYKINPDNSCQLIAKNLCKGTLWTVFFGKQHSVFGVWFDKQGNTYAAVSEDGCIKKITSNGEISIVYKSDTGSPVNGIFDKEGNLWVLEGLGLFKSEVKKVKMKEISTTKVWFYNNKKYIYGFVALIAFTLLFKKLRRKKVSS